MKQSIVLIVSVVIGLLAAVLTRTYLVSKDAEIEQLKADFWERHQEMEALCVARDVPGGTPLVKDDLGLRKVPASGWRGRALTKDDLDIIRDRKLLNKHKKGEILTWADIEGGKPKAGGLAENVKKEMRAVSVNCSGASSVSGMVHPNDHVDVIASFSFPKLGEDKRTMVQELVTYTILQNVHVLATGKETATSLGGRGNGFGPGSYSTVTLEVTLREAEMLVFAEQIKGRISLALRNPNDTTYKTDLPQIDLAKIKQEIESLNLERQTGMTK